MKFFQSTRFFILVCCLLSLAKLSLVAHNEIFSLQNDSASYANQAIGPWVLGGHPPGYPIWLRLCEFFGLPQRIAIEAMFLLSAVALSLALRKCFGAIAGYVAVALLSFAPATYFLFDLGVTEGYFTSLSLLALAISILLFAAKKRWEIITLSGGLGLVLGNMAITRDEDPLLALWLFLLIVALSLVWRDEASSLRQWRFWRKPLVAGLTTGLLACLIVSALCFSFYLAQGVFARSLSVLPGHLEFLADLAHIETGMPQQRFVPISRRSRELAYTVSPTFAKLRTLIENPQDSWQIISRQSGIPDGEIGGAWIEYAINLKVLDQAGGRPPLAAATYRKMNAELSADFKEGKLKRRFILHTFLGGDFFGLLKSLPPSIKAVTNAASNAYPDISIDQRFVPDLFDRAFGRRAALVPQGSDVVVQGWAFVDKPGRKISAVVVSSELTSSAPIIAQERPDVIKVYSAQNGWKPEVIGFHANVQSQSPDKVAVTYILDDGTHLQTQRLIPTEVMKVDSGQPGALSVMQGIDVFGSPNTKVTDRRHELEHSLYEHLQSRTLRRLGLSVFVLAFVLTSVALILRRGERCVAFVVFFGFASLMWIARILVYSLIDATSWPADQIIYLAPANVLGLVMFSVAVSGLAMLLKQGAWSKRS